VLLIVLVSSTFAALGIVAVAKVAQIAVGRLGLEPAAVLLFFGLAEAPPDELVLAAGHRGFRLVDGQLHRR
jgi:hypothetical protein